MEKKSNSTQPKISKIEITSDKISGRGGLLLLVKYIERIGFYSLFEKYFGPLKGSSKGLSCRQFVKQLTAWFIDGTDMSMSSFDRRKHDEAYAALLENQPDQMATSHQIKRMFRKFGVVGQMMFRMFLLELFMWRLYVEQPKEIILFGDSVVFDNDDAGKKYEERFQKEFISFAWPRTLMEVFDRPGKISKAIFPEKYNDIDECLRENHFDDVVTIKPMIPDLKECIAVYSDYVKEKEMRYSHDVIGRAIYEYFDCYGTFFNVNDDSYLIYNNEQYEIDNSIPFKALIYNLTGINYASQSSKIIWETIRAMCYIHARHTKEAAWIHTDHSECRIHYNLCNDRNELIRIEPGSVKLCKNGSNQFNIFLFPSPKTEPIEYDPETDIKAGLEKLWNALSYLSTHSKWKFYIIGLILNTFLIEFAKARGINKFTGHQGSGKTDAAGLITSLLYGKNFVTISSTASDYTDAALNPLTINDNLEINNIDDDRKNFLLCVATGITRQKRKAGTDTRNVYEKAVTQVITTSIESFEVPELIERAVIVPFDAKYFAANFPGSVVIEKQLIAHRNEILNSIFLLVSEMLIDFDLRKEAYIEYIQKHFPNHAKKRLNEHLACLALSIDVFLRFCEPAKNIYPQVEILLQEWIDEQNAENDETMRETNIIVRYLDMLSDEWRRNKLETYNLEPLDYQEPKQFLVFETTTANLLSAFQLLGKRFQFQQKFKSVRHLASRIKNEITIIESAGWSITLSRIVRGQRNFIFSQKPYEG